MDKLRQRYEQYQKRVKQGRPQLDLNWLLDQMLPTYLTVDRAPLAPEEQTRWNKIEAQYVYLLPLILARQRF